MESGPTVAHQILKHGLVGKPDKITEKLKEYTNAGVDQFLLDLSGFASVIKPSVYFGAVLIDCSSTAANV
jgi:hypothetical protein